MFKAIVFDIDGTLTRDISWIRLTNEIGGSIDFNDEVINKWEIDELTYEDVQRKLVENWNKDRKATKDNFSSILKNIPIREDAKDVVNYLKQKGYLVTMITGSFDLYAQIVGEELGIKDYFANTKLIWDENGKLINIETCKDSEAKNRKIDFFKEYSVKNNIQFNECVPIGDSSNDIELFKLTGNGIAVRTQFEAKELEAIAWKVVDNLIELKSVL